MKQVVTFIYKDQIWRQEIDFEVQTDTPRKDGWDFEQDVSGRWYAFYRGSNALQHSDSQTNM